MSWLSDSWLGLPPNASSAATIVFDPKRQIKDIRECLKDAVILTILLLNIVLIRRLLTQLIFTKLYKILNL